MNKNDYEAIIKELILKNMRKIRYDGDECRQLFYKTHKLITPPGFITEMVPLNEEKINKIVDLFYEEIMRTN